MLTVSSTQLCYSYPIVEFIKKQFACRDCYEKCNVAIWALSNSHWWKAVRLSWMWQENRMYIGYMMLHHRIQTDLKGVDAGVQASTPCTSVLTKSCADCRAFCEYDRMQEVAGCSRLHAGGCSLHAGFMQASCSLHTIVCRRLQVAASCMQDVAGCMQAACRLHAACMQPACISSVALA